MSKCDEHVVCKRKIFKIDREMNCDVLNEWELNSIVTLIYQITKYASSCSSFSSSFSSLSFVENFNRSLTSIDSDSSVSVTSIWKFRACWHSSVDCKCRLVESRTKTNVEFLKVIVFNRSLRIYHRIHCIISAWCANERRCIILMRFRYTNACSTKKQTMN